MCRLSRPWKQVAPMFLFVEDVAFEPGGVPRPAGLLRAGVLVPAFTRQLAAQFLRSELKSVFIVCLERTEYRCPAGLIFGTGYLAGWKSGTGCLTGFLYRRILTFVLLIR
jgi:hypothetical protein